MSLSKNVGALRIALLGTRGVPARYGGFETAVEEIGSRLSLAGHAVTVYGRGSHGDESPVLQHYKGMRLVHLPAVRHRVFETLSHSMLSVAHAVTREHFDVAFVFNAANAAVLPALRLRKVPAAMHVDGLEWRRAKWQGLGKAYYRVSESLSVRWADALIADSTGIADYYRDEFGVSTVFLPYGAPDLSGISADRLDELVPFCDVVADEAGEFARRRQHHADNARFRGGVGNLAKLTLGGGDRGGGRGKAAGDADRKDYRERHGNRRGPDLARLRYQAQ